MVTRKKKIGKLVIEYTKASWLDRRFKISFPDASIMCELPKMLYARHITDVKDKLRAAIIAAREMRSNSKPQRYDIHGFYFVAIPEGVKVMTSNDNGLTLYGQAITLRQAEQLVDFFGLCYYA